MAVSKAQPRAQVHKNLHEADSPSLVNTTKQTIKEDVAEGLPSEFIRQLLGFDLPGGQSTHETTASSSGHEEQPAVSGELKAGEVLHLGKAKSERKPAAASHKEAGEIARDYMDRIKHGSERASRREVSEMDEKIRQIMNELGKLVKSSAILQSEFAEVAVENKPVNPGRYHLTFFEWMLTVIRTARQKVEDSGAWLSTVKGKNSKKSGYWVMFKKHGTSFGLSNERSVATQTG